MTGLRFLFVACVASMLASECRGFEDWRWAGKVAVVTGASSGIGAETAVLLANKGVKVVGLARREEQIEALKSRTNGYLHSIKCDLTKEDDILKAFRWVETNLGGVDILINNAGVFLPSAPLINGSTADWKTTLRTNVLAVSICSREALKSMMQRGDDGHIVNINSISGHKVPEWKDLPVGMYYASKHAVTALTESLRIELLERGSSIKTTSISPGIVRSHEQIAARDNKKELAQAKNVPFIYSSDVADSVLYVLSTKPHVQIPELMIQGMAHTSCGV